MTMNHSALRQAQNLPLALLIFSACWTARAEPITFEGILEPGEEFREVFFVEEAGYVVAGGADDLFIVDESRRSFLDSDALFTDQQVFVMSNEQPFTLNQFRASSDSVGPRSLRLIGELAGDGDVQFNTEVSLDNLNLTNTGLPDIFADLSLTRLIIDPQGEDFFIDDIDLESTAPNDLSISPSFDGSAMTFEEILGEGEIRRLNVSAVEENDIVLLGGSMSIFGEETRSFFTSDALAFGNGDRPVVSFGESWALEGFEAASSNGLATLIVRGLLDDGVSSITQQFQITDDGFSALAFSSIFDSASFSAVTFDFFGEGGGVLLDNIVVRGSESDPVSVAEPGSLFLFSFGLLMMLHLEMSRSRRRSPALTIGRTPAGPLAIRPYTN